jgi:hypothetical protein
MLRPNADSVTAAADAECAPLLSLRWMYVASAYGVPSHEMADALYRDQEFSPMDRFSANAEGRQTFQAYVSCLLRWNYVRWKPNGRKGHQIEWKAVKDHFKAHAKPLSDRTVNALYKAKE